MYLTYFISRNENKGNTITLFSSNTECLLVCLFSINKYVSISLTIHNKFSDTNFNMFIKLFHIISVALHRYGMIFETTYVNISENC